MACKDLRQFLELIKRVDSLRIVEGADPDMEVSIISSISSSQAENPALLFDKFNGFKPGFRVCQNQCGSLRRVALLYGLPLDRTREEYIRLFRKKLNDFKAVPPQEVKEGPVMENVETGEKVDLLKFPVARWHEMDGGPYLGTRGGIINRDPDTGFVNIGTYRVQLFGKNTLGHYISPGHHGRIIREKYWAQGKSAPAAMFFGASPIYSDLACAPVPWGKSEFDYVGYLQEEPVEYIEGPATGLPIPAQAEIVVEGESPPPDVETRPEGPFGEWTGYYAHGGKDEPVFKVLGLYYRNDPIILGRSGSFLPGLAYTWAAIEEAGVPEVKGVASYVGVNITVISIKQSYPGHARHAALAAMGGPNAYHGRFTIVVDDDIDPWDINKVLWALATRCDPANSIDIVRGCWSTYLDPRIEPHRKDMGDTTNSRLIIDACKPYHWKDQYAPVVSVSPEREASVYQKWKDILDWS